MLLIRTHYSSLTMDWHFILQIPLITAHLLNAIYHQKSMPVNNHRPGKSSESFMPPMKLSTTSVRGRSRHWFQLCSRCWVHHAPVDSSTPRLTQRVLIKLNESQNKTKRHGYGIEICGEVWHGNEIRQREGKNNQNALYAWKYGLFKE